MGIFDFFKKGTERPTSADVAARQPSTARTSAGQPASKPETAKQPSQSAAKTTSDSVFDKPGGAVKPPVTEQPKAQEELYTIKSGDSLSKIAQMKYGNAQQWRKIYEANKDQIKNPDLIHPGQTIKIPR